MLREFAGSIIEEVQRVPESAVRLPSDKLR